MAADYLEWAKTTKSDVIRKEALKRIEELLAWKLTNNHICPAG